MLKKLLVLAMSTVMVFSMGASVFATEVPSNIGVSMEKTWEQVDRTDRPMTRGTKKPTKAYNVGDSGAYEMAGQSAQHYLYTEKLLTGQTSYTIEVANQKGTMDKLSFWVYKSDAFSDTLLKTGTARGQKTDSITVENLKKNDKIYVKFDYPCHFVGKVR